MSLIAKTQEDILRDNAWQPNEAGRIKIGLILDQFPFIRNIVRDIVLARTGKSEMTLPEFEASITRAFVSRLTEGIILKIPKRDSDGCGEVVLFLDKDGKLIEKEVRQNPWVIRLFLFWGPIVLKWTSDPWYYKMVSSQRSFRGKCLGDILQSFGDFADKVAFALSYDTRTKAIILYRRVKGMKLVNWMKDYEERALVQARDDLRRELDQE